MGSVAQPTGTIGFPLVRIDSIARVAAGGKSGLSGLHFVPVGIPAYGAGGINGYLPEHEFEDSAVILSSIGARCGKCFYPQGKWASLANTQLIFPDIDKVDRRFLWYQINNEALWRRSGTAQPYIKPSDVKAQVIVLPPLPEQRRIAAILDQADELRTKRRHALTLLDEMVDAVFEHHWGWGRVSGTDLVEIGEIYRVTGGKRLPKGQPFAEYETEHPYLRVSDMKNGTFVKGTLKYLTPEVQRSISRYVVATEDLVISIAGTIGQIAEVPEEINGANLTENAARLRPIDPSVVDGTFMKHQLGSAPVQAQIRASTGQVTIGKLALFRIEKLRVALPSMEAQLAFSTVVRAVQNAATLHQEHLARIGELFLSLQNRAFRGKL